MSSPESPVPYGEAPWRAQRMADMTRKDVNDFGPEGTMRVNNLDVAHELAHQMDREETNIANAKEILKKEKETSS